jgi:hypothetical protein
MSPNTIKWYVSGQQWAAFFTGVDCMTVSQQKLALAAVKTTNVINRTTLSSTLGVRVS